MPETGDLEAVETVMRATAAEFAGPGLEASTRALPLDVAGDTGTGGAIPGETGEAG